jgi:hypothetical protein
VLLNKNSEFLSFVAVAENRSLTISYFASTHFAFECLSLVGLLLDLRKFALHTLNRYKPHCEAASVSNVVVRREQNRAT